VIFTVGSLLLAVTPFTGPAGAIWIIGMRFVQGNRRCVPVSRTSQAHPDRRFPTGAAGPRLRVNGISSCRQFIGLVVGGVLARSTGGWSLRQRASRLVGTIWA